MIETCDLLDLDHLVSDDPLNDGLVFWAKVIPGLEGGPYAADISPVGTNRGTLNGGTAWSPVSAPGGWGSLSFNGTSDYVETASFSGQPTGNGSRTISAWVKPKSGYTGDNIVAFFGQDSVNPYGYGMYVTPAYKIKVEFDSSNGAVTGNKVLSPDTWYHVVATYNGSTNAVYVNGVLDNSVSYSSANTQAGEIDIGSWAAATAHAAKFAGLIDDVRVYNRALSAVEVAADYEDDMLGCPRKLRRLTRTAYSFPATSGGSIFRSKILRSQIIQRGAA